MQNGKSGSKMFYNNIFEGKIVLVTGHTGFKGSWMVTWLKMLGAHVYGYALPASEQDNFLKCGLQDRIKHFEGDVRNLAQLSTYFELVQPEIVFHFAAQPLVLLSYADPVSTFDTNIMGTVNFFEAVRRTPSISVAVNVTSDKCYHNKEWVWGYREMDPMGGKDPYSASKGAAELITACYQHSYFSAENTAHIASARAGNVIGGGDWADNRIVPDYFRAITENKAIKLRNPFATRPWQYVLEPLSGYLTLAAKLFTDGKKYSGGWNFGPEDGMNYSVETLIRKIIEKDGKGSVSISDNVNPINEASFLKLDISKAVNLLHWCPVLSFEETIEFTVNGYHDEVNSSNDDELFGKRMAQIVSFAAKAAEKKIAWTQ